MSAAAQKAPAIIRVERRSLIRPHRDIWHYDSNRSETRTYERGRSPDVHRVYSLFRQPPRAGYRFDGARPWGLHFSGPRGAAFTREIFLATRWTFGGNAWLSPLGVSVLNALVVGAGAGPGQSTDGFFFTWPGGGGAGGSVAVVTNIPSNPLQEQFDLIIPAGGGPDPVGLNGGGGEGSTVRLSIVGNVFCFSGNCGGGGGADGSAGEDPSGSPGVANAVGFGAVLDPGSKGGAGGGGSWVNTDFGSPLPGLGGAGSTAGNGGQSSNNPPTTSADFGTQANGGGGGAGANGTNGVGTGGPGSGGDGIIPPPHPFGAWGTDIGENGYFGGGGKGCDITGSPNSGAVGSNGLGNGAANTGGGGHWNVGGTTTNGRSGIIVIVYATP